MTGVELQPLQLATRLALALGLAVFLGLAYEEVYKREQRTTPGGVRTFPMLTVSGAMLYLIDTQHALPFTVGLLGLALWLHAYLRNAQPTPSATSMIVPTSSLVAYLLGPVALAQPPWVAVSVAVCSVLLLGTREELHKLIFAVPPGEVVTAGKFLILVGIILPLVPSDPISAAIPLSPYHVWLAVVAVCSLSYLSYLVQSYVRTRASSLLPALLGGIYSSTATTVVLAKRMREAGAARSELAAGIVAATAIMFLRLGVVVALFSPGLAIALVPALGVLFAGGAMLAAGEWRRTPHDNEANLQIPAANPLQIPTAIAFAAMFVVISLLTTWIRTAFGQQGVLALAALVGVTDIDPFVINIAQGGASGLSTASLAAAVLIAAAANNLAKAGYCIAFAGWRAARRPVCELLALAVCGFGAAAAYLL